ncbi:MAG TPA: hypothetical protein VGK29_20815 [Paludibaculum sp.]|jgi:hypothetical protein
MPVATSLADIQINKTGAGGRPAATVTVDAGVSLDKLVGVLQREITRNSNLRKKLGLKACTACISGMDLDIRHRFDHVMQVDLNKIG